MRIGDERAIGPINQALQEGRLDILEVEYDEWKKVHESEHERIRFGKKFPPLT